MWRNKVRDCDTNLQTLPVVSHYITLYEAVRLSDRNACSAKQSMRVCAVFTASVKGELKQLCRKQQSQTQSSQYREETNAAEGREGIKSRRTASMYLNVEANTCNGI